MKDKQITVNSPPAGEIARTPGTEKALWIAVLNQAVKDAKALVQKVEKDPDLWTNPLFRSEVLHLKRYFRCRSMEPGGFGFICDLMGVDAGQAARQIDELYLRHLNRPVEQRPARVAMLLAI
ncbi:MAG: hypothetical protein HQL63_06450 [Magnetococcales bacterium]|nr:hypothetical protein [Magnetococcales bacterium]